MSEYSAKENLSKLLSKTDKVMHLKLFVEGSYNLKKKKIIFQIFLKHHHPSIILESSMIPSEILIIYDRSSRFNTGTGNNSW